MARPPPPQQHDSAVTSRSEHAYVQLEALLDDPAMPPHTRLPGEETLADRFGVSRPVLRQALARLRAEGRIYVRKGSGSYRAEPIPPAQAIAFSALNSIPDVRHFLDFRCSIEGESAARAAQRHDRSAIAAIQQSRKQLEAALAEGASGIEQDIAFHLAIAQATGNRFFAETLASLADPMRFSIRLVRELADGRIAERRQEVIQEHAAIAEAIAAAQTERARDAMIAHLRGGIARLFDV